MTSSLFSDLGSKFKRSTLVQSCPASWSAVGSLQSVDLFWRCKSAKPQKTKIRSSEFWFQNSKTAFLLDVTKYKNKSSNTEEIIMDAWILKSLQYSTPIQTPRESKENRQSYQSLMPKQLNYAENNFQQQDNLNARPWKGYCLLLCCCRMCQEFDLCKKHQETGCAKDPQIANHCFSHF